MLNRIKKELTEPGEVEHEYLDLDLIRLVYEDGELIGWYRPGDVEEAEQAEQNDRAEHIEQTEQTESVQNGTDGAHRSEAEVC
jgi:hypothetical protein